MPKKNKERNTERTLAYTTNPAGFNPFEGLFSDGENKQNGEADKSAPIRIHLEKKGRGGKTVSIIKGIKGSETEIEDLLRSIKNHCGTGGSFKAEQLIIQGDQREKILDYLKKLGYHNVKKSGG